MNDGISVSCDVSFLNRDGAAAMSLVHRVGEDEWFIPTDSQMAEIQRSARYVVLAAALCGGMRDVCR